MSTTSEPAKRQRCSICGTENDPFYTYCRQCLAELSASSSTPTIR